MLISKVREYYRARKYKALNGDTNNFPQESFDNCSTFFNLSMDSQAGDGIENLVYLMNLVLKQAKEQVQVTSSFGKRKRKRKRRRTKAERKRSCARAYFDRSVDMLVDIVRKDRDTAYLDLDNESVLAKTLLKWLYFGKYIYKYKFISYRFSYTIALYIESIITCV